MKVSLLNLNITIQKHTVAVDKIGNHINVWEDYYACHATASGENGSAKGGEDEAAGTTVDHSNMDFTIRCCQKVEGITTDGFRVVFAGELYDIIGIDHMNYKHKAYKLRCRKVKR